MTNINIKFQSGATSSIPGRFHPILFLGLITLCILFQSCYSSTAVKGVPVRELAMTKEKSLVKTKSIEVNKDALASMSTAQRNNSFIEISGIPEYRIGPLDVLEINSYLGDKVVKEDLTVNNRGKISYSFIDDLDVAGLTPSQLDVLLKKKLSNYIKHPRINVIVKEFNSKSVTVLGELASLRASTGGATSGRVYLHGKTTLTDLIALAGGYTVNADIKDVKLVRQGKTYDINLFDILEKGDQSKNVIIDAGDVVNIPALPYFGEKVFVMGEVNSQGIYPLKDASDLLSAISMAGSVTPLAKEENTLIVRGYPTNEHDPLVMMSDVKALLRKADLKQNVPLENGDLIYVPRMLIGDVTDWISNTLPLLDFLFYPKTFQGNYFTKDYLHINRR